MIMWSALPYWNQNRADLEHMQFLLQALDLESLIRSKAGGLIKILFCRMLQQRRSWRRSLLQRPHLQELR